MSKFLTPPVWYDGNGTLNNMLTGKSVEEGNVVIGSSAEAGENVFTSVIIFGSATGTQSRPISNAIIAGVGASAFGTGVVAIGSGAAANSLGGIAIGNDATMIGDGGIAIGSSAVAEEEGAIAIGDGATASAPNTIQLGKNAAYTLRVGNGRMSLNIGSTAESNWVSAKSSGISQGLYLVRYGAGTYINTVYLMAPIAVTNPFEGGTSKNDWYFPFNISPFRISTGSAYPVVTQSYYLKVDKSSTTSNLQITPGYYRYDSGTLPGIFVSMGDGSSVMLFKIL